MRLRALMVGDADGHEKHADRDQQEAHGEQARAGYTAPIAVMIVSAAPAAGIERIVIVRTASVPAAEFGFRIAQGPRRIVQGPGRTVQH